MTVRSAAGPGARRVKCRSSIRSCVTAVIALCLAACATTPVTQGVIQLAPRREFHALGVRTIGHLEDFGGTTVGGLSGIDYDAAADRYYLISDDRSRFSPTRFYTARLAIDEHGFHDVALQSVVTLEDPRARAYGVDEADAEAIRLDPATRTLWWTSEGLRRTSTARRPAHLIDPFVRHATLDGHYLGDLPIAPMFRMHDDDAHGPRDNLVFEGLSLTTDGRALWVGMEGPRYEDGAMATADTGAWARFTRHPRIGDDFGPADIQLAYRIDPIPARGAWTLSHAQTGVSEILAVDATHLFVVERAFVIGTGWHVRLFEADIAGATDVRTLPSLTASDVTFVPIAKALVLDFDTLPFRVDNIEGVCFGPTLPNGHRTLVFVSDDNFNPGQTTQLIAFELIEP